MFTGIVQGVAQVADIRGDHDLKTFAIQFPKGSLDSVSRGASIAINGVCLTVTEFDSQSDIASFDVMFETLDKTNLGELTQGDNVNFERAARIGDEIGGHLMSGHICRCITVTRVEQSGPRHSVYFNTPEAYRDYLLPKGFVGLNGCSLTIGDKVDDEFCVHLIPETLAATTFGALSEGDTVNLEVDPQTQAIVDTVKRYMQQTQPS